MQVEVVSDVVCPWCYIGKRRFETALGNLRVAGVTFDLDVRYRAYQLDPQAPLDAPIPVREAYARKFGGYERADAILASVTKEAAHDGISMRLDQAIRANTLRAHRLLKLVERDAPELQADINEAIMHAYFTAGLDISQLEVLDQCARDEGFTAPNLVNMLSDDSAEAPLNVLVRTDTEWAREHDVTAVPTFVINQSFAVPGAQDVDVFERLLAKMISR
jgi:predicted DsbA family dithiol-disulfide isomerase